MELPAALLGSGWAVAGWAVLLGLLARDVSRAPWARLAAAGHLNAGFAAIVILTLLWSVRAGVRPGLGLHFLCAVVPVLMFGRGPAFVALIVVLAAVTVNRGGDWASFGLNGLLLAAFPAALAGAIAAGVRRYLPTSRLAFIFGNGFFGAWATLVVTGALGLAVLAIAGAYPAAYVVREYLPYFVLLGFAEGWLAGTAVTLLVVFRPEWLAVPADRSAGRGG